MKRTFLFVITNIAILVVLSIAVRVLGLDGYLSEQGIDYVSLLVFAAIFGMGGAFISLAMSKWSAKRLVGAHVIERPSNATEKWVVDIVARQAKAAGIGMPEVAIYEAPEVNAFATGMNKNAELHASDSTAHVDQALVALVADVRADLVVMGCYGHSRIREQMFGGVTRALLARPPAPILMAH